MSLDAAKVSRVQSAAWNRGHVQLGGGLLIAVLIPWALRIRLEVQELTFLSLQHSLIGTMVAVVAGYYSFRRLSRYPGVRASYHIIPSYAASYATVLACFFFARLDYSRVQFLASFMLCILWYYAVYFRLQRQKNLHIGVVPVGEVDRLFDIDDVDWVKLDGKSDLSQFNAVVADLRADIPDEWERFLADCALQGILVMHVKQIEESLTGRVAIDHLSENNLGSLLPGIIYGRTKRIGDFLISVVSLPLLVPILLLIGLAIRMNSKGPALFRQQRMGYRGKSFTMYKFRTMRDAEVPADDARNAAITRDDDDRVTSIGKYLRRYRIDELPQVINILKGEMSWIGPRPEAVPLSRWYEEELPFYRYRHIVRPGVTGWAQVKQGHVADVDDVQYKLHYDFYYIKNFSFWLDLLIIAGTIRTVANGFGAR